MVASFPEPGALSSVYPGRSFFPKEVFDYTGDIILRASDSHDFRAQKLFIIKSSRVVKG
jgi:hypothetical protein